MPKMNRIFIRIIIILIIFHSLSVAGVLHIFGKQDGFLNLMGLDNENEYFDMSQAIIRGKPIMTIRTIGWPLFLIPFIHLFKATEVKQILFPVSFFNSLILYNICIILIAIITLRLTNNLKVAILAAILWTIFPWIVYFLTKVNPEYDYPGLSLSRLLCQMFMHFLTDGASVCFVLSAFYFFIISLNNKKSLWPIISGLSFAISVLIRPPNIALLSVVMFIYIKRKEFRKTSVFIITALIVFLPQFIYNWFASHSLLNLKTIIGFENRVVVGMGYGLPFYSMRFVPSNLIQIFQKFPFYILFILGLVSIIVIMTLIDLYRKAKLPFYILCLWILAYIFINGLYYDTAANLLRYAMPIIPALLICISIGTFRVISIKWKMSN